MYTYILCIYIYIHTYIHKYIYIYTYIYLYINDMVQKYKYIHKTLILSIKPS